MAMDAVANKVAAKSILASLVSDPSTTHVGYVFSMSYTEARVLTNDQWRSRVFGIPKNSFLIATAFDPEAFASAHELDKVVILLRVIEPAPLPQDGEIVKAIIEHHQNRTSVTRVDAFDGLDPYTHNQIQYGGLLCRVVGSFCMENGRLLFGADVEDFFSASHLRAYSPNVGALEKIVNYADPIRLEKSLEDAKKMGFNSPPEPFEIGHIRYTSANRLQKEKGTYSVPVRVQPMDFLSRRTAVLGMTRTGKSNTVKTMVSAVALSAMKAQVSIGQLIFDMNGEYANATQQDFGSSIADVFSDNTIRYRGLITPGFYDLRNNFYESLEAGLEILQNVLRDKFTSNQPDQQTFLRLSLQEPPTTDISSHVRWQKQVAIYRCILSKAGYPLGNQPDSIRMKVGKDVFAQIYDALALEPNSATKEAKVLRVKSDYGDPNVGLSHSKMEKFLLKAREADVTWRASASPTNGNGINSSGGDSWFDPNSQALANLLAQLNSKGSYINGWNSFTIGNDYHSPNGSQSIPSDIYGHLLEGRIVIMDLSVGSESVRKTMALQIAGHIIDESSKKFNEGITPPSIVIYVEEAHNLIGKESKLDETWPRIAKEGAKFGISLVYSTQEPSSIHPNIMANTENLFVTHLNNEKEVKALSAYYDFGDFGDSIMKAQDVGFARIKTLSAPFVIPVQIKKFDPDAVSKLYGALARPKSFIAAPKPAEAN